MEVNQDSSIGIFDSGFGGLTVMHAVRAVLPHENIIYFGDTARLPYGNKSAETVLRYARECAQFLLSKKIKLLVIACNTACACAMDKLAQDFPIPIVGVIPAAVEELAQLSKNQGVAVLGTRSTIASGVYQEKIREILPKTTISAISCPLFVPLVEEGYTHHAITEMAIQEYLGPLKKRELDAALLGCTHYPLLERLIQKELGNTVTLINPAISCAKSVLNVLDERGLLNSQTTQPTYQFYVSDDPEKFRLLGKDFLRFPIDRVHAI